MTELLAALQNVTGLDVQRTKWLLNVVALILPGILLPAVDRLARRPR